MAKRVRTHLAFLALTVLALALTTLGVMRLAGGGDAALAQGVGSATVKVVAPSGSQPLNTDFVVNTRLDSFTPGTSPTWAGWNMKLQYDPALLTVVSTASGGICSAAFWFLNDEPPFLNGGCAFQASTATGNMDTITFRCTADGVAALHLVSQEEDPVAGTALFDENAVFFDTTVIDGTVTCGTGGPSPTPTNTPTRTPTSTPTNTRTPTPTRTPSPTLTPSPTPTPCPNGICPTNTPTFTPTSTPTRTLTPTRTPTHTPTRTPTAAATPSPTRTAVSQVGPVAQTPVRTPVGGVAPGAGRPLPRAGSGSAESGATGDLWLLLTGLSLVGVSAAVYGHSRQRKMRR